MQHINNLSLVHWLKNVTEPPQTSKMSVDVFRLVIFLLVMIAALIGNLLVCTAVIKFRFLWTHTNFVLVSLAATDLCMVVVMALNATMVVTVDWTFGDEWCNVAASAALTFCLVSILHLCFLSVDRFISIYRPFRYPLFVTSRRVLIILVLLWIFPVVALHVPIADIHFRGQVYGCSTKTYTPCESQMLYTFILLVTFVAVPFAIILITNVYVFLVAIRHARRLRIMEKRFCNKVEDIHLGSSSPSRKTIRKSLNTRLGREIKTAKSFALLVSAFLVCYVPFFTLATYRKYVGNNSVNSDIMLFVTWLGFANSFCNPLLYGARFASFRNAFKMLCCNCCRSVTILEPISGHEKGFMMSTANSVEKNKRASCIRKNNNSL